VRSGVVISVHAFAVDPGRGIFMLAFLAVVVGASLILFAWRASEVRKVSHFELFSRETFILTNNLLFLVMMVTVLLGTLYPLLIESLGYGKLSVGSPYFNIVMFPFLVVTLLVMAAAPAMHWQKTDINTLQMKWLWMMGVSVALAFAFPLTLQYALTWRVILGLTLSFWVILMTLSDVITKRDGKWRIKRLSLSRWGMITAHIGLAVLVFGVVVNAAYSIHQDVRMAAGDRIEIGPYQFELLGVRAITGPNYSGEEGGVKVTKQGQEVIILKPEKRL